MQEIYVWSKIPNLIRELRKVLPKINFHEIHSGEDASLQNAEVLIGDFDDIGPQLYNFKRMKWIQGTWAGVDALMPHIEVNKPLPFIITRYSGQHFGRIMTEYVIASIVNHERNWQSVTDNQKNCIWSKQGNIGGYRIISDLNIGIMGIGNIGNEICQYLHSFGAKIFGYGRREKSELNQESAYLSEYFTKTTIKNFLESCDYLVNVLPSTEETVGLLNGNILENCKTRKSVFINIGRGTIIKEDDLISALNNGWISHAHLDVFNNEPLPKESLLWKMSNVTITPHVSGMSRPQDIAQQFHDNYILYLNNKKIPTEVDVGKRY